MAVAALLLLASCSGNDSANGQRSHQTNVDTHGSHSTSVSSTLTQASSISTQNVQKSSVSAKQAPVGAANGMDGFIGNPPAVSPSPQNPLNLSPSPADSSQFAQQVLELVNQERTKAGLRSLSMNASLSNMALAKAKDMNDNHYFAHQSPTYGSPFDMMKTFGITYNTAGENIAQGQRSPAEVMNQWMNSPDHRANILNGSFTQIGVAYYNNQWVQEFIG